MALTVTSGAPDDVSPHEAASAPGSDVESSRVRTAWLMIVLGAVGLVASALLVIERVNVASDPDYVPPCSINPILTCTSAMLSPQGELFGFPNPVLGVAGFPVVIATGAALLAGASMARWYWRWAR